MPCASRYTKQLLHQTLLEKLNPLPFWPIAWTKASDMVIFYVDDDNVAEKLGELNFQITMPNRLKLIIDVEKWSPNVKLNPEVKNKMKLAIRNRYNASKKALDLTKFHADPILQDHFCALYKRSILKVVIRIIYENIPEVEALCLNDNKIMKLNIGKEEFKKLKNVRILHLARNKIQHFSDLNSLAPMPLVELVLDGNPISDVLRDVDLYASEIRYMFPNVMKLDTIDLSSLTGFEITEEHRLPPPCQTFLCNAEGGKIVRQFLEQYFQLFDSENRQMLVQAYHENSVFSLTMSSPYITKDETTSCPNWFATENRNLMRVTDSDKRFTLLKRGNMSIVSFLKDMPMTSHDVMNFRVDLTVFTPSMLSFTITGQFEEIQVGQENSHIRGFSRTFIIIPASSGIRICNEELHITNATEGPIKTFKSTPRTPRLNVIATPPNASVCDISGPSAAPIPEADGIDDLKKMVETLSLQSGMNLK